MPLPLLPRNISDPTAQDKRERSAMADFEKRMKRIGSEVAAILDRQHYSVITLNAEVFTQTKYQFNVDELTMDAIGMDIDNLIDRIILGGGDSRKLWLMTGYVEPAYQQGTGMTQANLAVQSAAYKLARPDLVAILNSEAYKLRLGYVRAREYEEMKGLSADLKKQFRTILMDGMAQGINPNVIAERITEQTGTNIVRSRRIARTEITTALRRARVDEAEDATLNLGLLIKMMQLSALSATTRLSHAIRHAKLYTFEQVRAWMSTSPNMINCKCTFVEVLVDKDGKPWTPDIIDKAKAMRPDGSEYDNLGA
jgi:hypothetical protein